MNQSISSLSENEKNSGKIWTLLRYSKAFQKDVKWFSAKYKTATNKRAKQATRENAKCEFHTKYEEIENINQFAATALQWMFPMPVFENRNPTIGWGPYIAHKMDGDKIDAFAEWKEYEAAKDFLSLETDWFSVNAGFKRDLIFHYSQIDSRVCNPVKNDRSDAPFPHETDFFNDFELAEIINNGPGVDVELTAKIKTAGDLKNLYRVFAVPRHLHSKKAVDEAFEPIIKAVKDALPTKASELFGTDSEWRDFMKLKEIQTESKWSKKDAIISMTKLRSSVYLAAESRRTYETVIKKNITAIEDKIFRCYPNFQF